MSGSWQAVYEVVYAESGEQGVSSRRQTAGTE